uniref:Prolyl 4-hydroxylase subunit alpha-2-like n=1 Tax=Sinocyclocheilus anshuiensis TaxID=1608454 RepID=A0A671LWK6_9TELE
MKFYLQSSVLLLLQLGTYSDPVDPEEIKDPAAAFILLMRLRSEWLSIEKYTSRSLYEYNVYQTLLEYAQIPQVKDLEGAALGLISLQDSNLIDAFISHFTETSLNAAEAYIVGLVAYNEDKFQHAFLWFLYSLDRLTEYSTVTEEELLHYLSDTAYHFGSLPVAIYFSQRLLNLGEFMVVRQLCDQTIEVINFFASDPTNDEVKVQLDLYRLLRYQRKSNLDIFTLNNESSNSYEALCRGEVDERTSKRQRALSCRYSTGGGNPRLIYAPVKEEVEWDEPGIIRYHDITGRGSVKDPGCKVLLKNHFLVFSVSLKEDYPVVARVNQRIADITGLSMESAEDLHVQNYGIGGKYEPHYDMSDVEIGGATVFPKVGVALKPKKGSAVFWYNLHKNGNVDLNTEHAGCDVANKWIHEFGQEFRRHCSLSYWT